VPTANSSAIYPYSAAPEGPRTRAAAAKDKVDEVAPAGPSDAASGVKQAVSGAKDALPDSASDAADSAANAVKKSSNPFSGFFGGAPHSCACITRGPRR